MFTHVPTFISVLCLIISPRYTIHATQTMKLRSDAQTDKPMGSFYRVFVRWLISIRKELRVVFFLFSDAIYCVCIWYMFIVASMSDVNDAFADLAAIRRLLDAEGGGSTCCPSCEMPFDKGKKRRLIDTCGHERCYTCMFTNEVCPLCNIRQDPSLQQTQIQRPTGRC